MPRPQAREIPKTMVCGILVFMWPFGPLCKCARCCSFEWSRAAPKNAAARVFAGGHKGIATADGGIISTRLHLALREVRFLEPHLDCSKVQCLLGGGPVLQEMPKVIEGPRNRFHSIYAQRASEAILQAWVCVVGSKVVQKRTCLQIINHVSH